MLDRDDVLARIVAQNDLADRTLAHHVAADDGSRIAVDLDAVARVLDRERIVKLREDAVVETDDGHDPILQALLRHERRLTDANGVDRLRIEQEAQRVDVVHGDVEDHPAAGLRLVEPPALQMRRQVDGVEDASEQRPPDGAALNQFADLAVSRGVAKVMVRRHDDRRLFACTNHGDGVMDIQGERLLAQHVFSGFCRCEHLGQVQLVRGADVHHLHRRVGEQRLERVVR